MAKKLIINCSSCDARSVLEETLAAYESVLINCGIVTVTAESKALLNRYNVTLNCGDVLEVDHDVKISTINGPGRIMSADTVSGGTYLQINGPLEIGPNTQKVLESYVGIVVNGPLLCPESVSGCLGKIKVNGPITCYPDDAIVLKRSAVIDKLFVLRAKSKLYWSAKRMVMVDPQLDGEKLAAKGATFSSKEVILAESKAESLIELIDEKADIIIVPDGTSVILDDVELSDVTLRKYGSKLYISGDLKVTEEGENVLAQMEYLNIRGDVTVPERLKELLLEKADIEGDVKVPKTHRGRYICDKINFRVSKWMLEQEKDGICLEDCINVVIDEDVPNELILERLSITDCVSVKCTSEQESAVSMICEDVVAVGGNSEETAGMSIGEIVRASLGGSDKHAATKVVNTSDYVL